MKKRKLRRTVIILLVLGMLIGGWIWIENGLRPNVAVQGEARLKNLANDIMNNAVNETLNELTDISELIHIEKDGEGHIEMIRADSTQMNRIAVMSAMKAQEKIEGLRETSLGIPLGNIIGGELFSGMGPSIHIRVQPLGGVNTHFHTEFESVGINQTRYKVYIILDAAMLMVVGAEAHAVSSQTQVLISEVIIVGDVPQTYADVAEGDQFMNLIP